MTSADTSDVVGSPVARATKGEAVDILRDLTQGIIIEVTSKCNLRCSYCAKADKVREAELVANVDMGDPMLMALYRHCKDNGITNVTLSGVGETAMFPGWHNRLTMFLDDPDFNVLLVSNFIRLLDDDDLDALSKFHALQISFDSSDYQTVRRLRSHADLRSITYNIVRLQQRCRALGRRPQITVNATLCRENIGHIQALAGFCRELNVDRLLVCEVISLTRNNYVMPETLSGLTSSEVELLARQIMGAEGLLAGSDTTLILQDHLKLRVDEIVERMREAQPVSECAATFHRPLVASACLDPWTTPFVRADGAVYACCIISDDAPIMGNINNDPLPEILGGARYRSVRRSILEGRPETPCDGCSLARAVSFDELAAEVRGRFGDTTATAAASRVERAEWPELAVPDAVPLVENGTLAIVGDEVHLTEDGAMGYHRLLIGVPVRSGTLSMLIKPAGRRRLRIDLVDEAKAVTWRAAVVFKAFSTFTMSNGEPDAPIVTSRGDGWYHLEVSAPGRLTSIDLALMREDDAVNYRGDGRSGIKIKRLSLVAEAAPAAPG
jgi:MoaA/NifB/PqqE/SkfB family radical SAM enzyme